MDSILVNSQNKAYSLNGYLLKYEPMTLVRHWDGADAPVSGKWYDKIANQYWTLTNSTHTEDYYQFLNSTASSAATSYGTLNGTMPDLGYHWKVVMDVEFQTKSGSVSYVPADFGSITSTGTNTCAFSTYVNSNKNWTVNAKLNGNDSGSTYKPDLIAESGIDTVGVWVRRTVEIGVRASSVVGKDEMYLKVNGVTATTPTPFTPVRMNRWASTGYYLARSVIGSSTTYPYSTSVRVYDIKMYKEQ